MTSVNYFVFYLDVCMPDHFFVCVIRNEMTRSVFVGLFEYKLLYLYDCVSQCLCVLRHGFLLTQFYFLHVMQSVP